MLERLLVNMDAVFLPLMWSFWADLGTSLNLDILIVLVGYIAHVLYILRSCVVVTQLCHGRRLIWYFG